MIVFSHLDMKNRLQACLVCKKWLELINCKSLLNDISIYVRFSTFEDYSYPCMTRNFLNVKLIEMCKFDYWKIGFEYIRPCVEHLGLCTDQFERNNVFSLDTMLENLLELDVFTKSAWPVFPSCPNLIQLTLCPGRCTDAFIAVMQKTMKRLKIFRLGNAVVDDPSMYKKYYPPSVTYEDNPSSEVLTFPAIKSFLFERTSTLSEIDIFQYPLAVSTYTDLLSIKGLNLTRLCLCTDEINSSDSSKFFNNLLRNQQNLKALYLQGFKLIVDVDKTFCAFLPNIEELELTCDITDKSLKDICSLKKLKKLGLMIHDGFTPSGCREAISGFNPIQIKHLTLINFFLPKDSAFVFKQLTHLVKLELSTSLVTDSHVHVISTYLVKLENLCLNDNDGISDHGITGVLEHEENKDNLFSCNKALHNLKRLRKLDLSFCPKLTSDGLNAAIRFPLLDSLKLYGLKHSGINVPVLLSQNPKLAFIEKRFLEC